MKNKAESLLIFIRGLLMGTADAIPGVSGGTIALITGIYSRLVHAINQVNNLLVKELASFKLKKVCTNIKKLDFALFIPLLLGILIALFSFSHVISLLLSDFTALTYAFFFGLILSSAYFVYKHTGKINLNKSLFLILGFLFALWIVSLETFKTNHSLVVLFLSGAIAICAMILPGISGAFILVLLNQYEFVINAIKNLLVSKLVVFGLGAILGLLSFSKLLDYLLTKHKPLTMSFLTGLMVGSLRIPVEKVMAYQQSLPSVIIVALLGFVLVFLLEKKFS